MKLPDGRLQLVTLPAGQQLAQGSTIQVRPQSQIAVRPTTVLQQPNATVIRAQAPPVKALLSPSSVRPALGASAAVVVKPEPAIRHVTVQSPIALPALVPPILASPATSPPRMIIRPALNVVSPGAGTLSAQITNPGGKFAVTPQVVQQGMCSDLLACVWVNPDHETKIENR